MNSKFRTFMMTLVMIPCLFVFAGCNQVAQLDQKVTIDTRGNYAISSAKTTWDIIKNCDYSNLDSEDGNFRLNLDFSISLPESDEINGNISYIIRNVKSKNDETSTIIAIRTKINTIIDNQSKQDIMTEYHISETKSSNTTEKYYVDYSFAMSNNEYETAKYDISEIGSLPNEKLELYQQYWQIPIMIIYSSILPIEVTSSPQSGHIWATPNTEFKLVKQNNTTKIQVTTPNGKLFIVNKENKFYGLQVDNLKLFADDIPTTISGGMVVFEDDIELPDFSEYNKFIPQL